MACSEAQLAANLSNSKLSTGPRSESGKAISRRGSLKFGLTGQGIVLPQDVEAEIDRRAEAFRESLKPKSPMGQVMIRKLAMFSVRSERCAEHENYMIAERVRNAVANFDQEQIDKADALFDVLHENPRTNLRRLKTSPEGIDRLLDGWRDLRDDLKRKGKPCWNASHLEQAALMTGVRSDNARSTILGDLSDAAWGDFHALADHDGGNLEEDDRRSWARARLVERIGDEIAALERHRETLDFARIELDRLEAPGRALFDPSKPATLARRYEADADRGYYKALKEYRQAEAEFAAQSEVPPRQPEPAPPTSRLASFRDDEPPPDYDWEKDLADIIADLKSADPQLNRQQRRAARPKLPRR